MKRGVRDWESVGEEDEDKGELETRCGVLVFRDEEEKLEPYSSVRQQRDMVNLDTWAGVRDRRDMVKLDPWSAVLDKRDMVVNLDRRPAVLDKGDIVKLYP